MAIHKYRMPTVQRKVICDLKGFERYHSMGNFMDRVLLGPNTNRDHLLYYNLGCYCPETFEAAKRKKKVVPLGVEHRTYGLSHLRSATELQHASTTSLHSLSPFYYSHLLLSSDINGPDMSLDLGEPCPSSLPML